jgi:plastocyanin
MIRKFLKKHIKPAGFILITLCMSIQAETLRVAVLDNNGKPVSGVVVYALAENPASVQVSDTIEVEQRNKEFQPFISVVTTGSSAIFPNHDGIGHHVYSFSPVKSFDLPLSEKVLTTSILFDKPGIVTVGCNIHDWMVGYIYIIDTPYYALTDDEGNASINDIPANDYSLQIWHPGINLNDVMKRQIRLNVDNSEAQKFSINIKPEYLWKPKHPPLNEEEEY